MSKLWVSKIPISRISVNFQFNEKKISFSILILISISRKKILIFNFNFRKGFSTKTTFDEHMNVHTGDKPFKCKYCPNTFASRGTKEMHQKGHLGIKRKPKKV